MKNHNNNNITQFYVSLFVCLNLAAHVAVLIVKMYTIQLVLSDEDLIVLFF